MQPDFWVDFPGLGIYDLPVSRVAFEIFGWPVYWYGLLIAAALIVCLFLAVRDAPRFGLKSEDILDTFILIIPLMIVMARLYYVVFEWDYFSSDLRRIFNTREGGLAFYGGVIGGVLAVLIITRVKKIKLSTLMDFLAVYVPLGQAIGRWGNFFNQEAFGCNTTLPWGMYSNQTEAYLRSVKNIPGLDPTQPVHPTFLYEFVANMLIFAWLLRVRKRSKFPFETTLWYFLLYGFVRFFVEGIRTDPLMIKGTSIRVSQLLSAVLFTGSLVLLMILHRRQQNLQLMEALAGAEGTLEGSAEQQDQTGAPMDDKVPETSDFVVIDEGSEPPSEKEGPQ
ncbi:MAG: prolipoprotein diacylglyceryl transferase [Clostridia bacterium]|nr:prolipoprotein diacylglyceryl transferase [Clostridia bacterium]